jgi:hypothetical protein
MKKTIKIISAAILVFFCAFNFTYASSVGGIVGTGLNTGINGTVIMAPSTNVPEGTYTSIQNVSLAAVDSIHIYYTTDGSNPSCSSSNAYSAPITISATSTLKAIACYGNDVASNVSSFAYVINLSAYTVTVSAGTGGSISPVSGSVLAGSSHTYTITASSGYQIADVLADGTSVGAVSTYTFSDIASNHTISATFSVVSSSAANFKTGDINKDGDIDEYDFGILMDQWEQTGTSLSADLNNDDTVDEYDFAILMANWGL